jgi:Ran GTPase-activating protein (RanGAP) involved in mRNA processing and transport
MEPVDENLETLAEEPSHEEDPVSAGVRVELPVENAPSGSKPAPGALKRVDTKAHHNILVAKMTKVLEAGTIDTLSLEDEYLNDGHLGKLASAIGGCRSLTSLKLKNNHFTNTGFAALASHLESSDTVTYIDISGNQIGAGVSDLVNAMKSWKEPKLETLILSDCFKSPDASIAISTIITVLRELNSVKTLVLNDNELGPEAMKLAKLLSEDKNLTKLDISSNLIDTDGGVAIAKALQKNATLQSLDLSENAMSSSEVGIAFADTLNSSNTTLTSLALGIGEGTDWGIDNILERNALLRKLGENTLSDAEKADKTQSEVFAWDSKALGDAGAQLVSRMLATNSTVKKLSLANNDISVGGCKELRDLLTTNNSISHVNLEGNSAGPQGLKVLAKAVSESSKLSFLNLKNNGVGSRGLIALTSALAQEHRRAVAAASGALSPKKSEQGSPTRRKTTHGGRKVSSSPTTKGTTKVVRRSIASVQQHNSSLHHLDLAENSICKEGANQLTNVMKNNLRLIFLSLRTNNIGPEGAKDLSTVLTSHSCILSHLDVGENNLGDEGASFIADGMKQNMHLRRLMLCGNGIGPDGTRAISRCLGANKTLEILSLRDNKLGDPGAKVSLLIEQSNNRTV